MGERKIFVLALRELWVHVGLSVRSYAQQEAINPGSLSRYLNGGVLPAEEFVLDLVDAAQRKTGLNFVEDTRRLRELLRAAQEAQPSNWGATKRWKAMEHKQRARADLAEADAAATAEEVLRLRRLLEDRSAVGDDELAVAREKLRSAEFRIVALEQECASLRASLDGGPRRPEKSSSWTFYASSLAARDWSTEAITTVDSNTDQVMSQLADPAAPEVVSRRGTVVQYPGSGKTANVVGLIAKSIDVGYRLVIVLTGNLNVVRRQAQRQIDEGLPRGQTVPNIYRLTTQDSDYRLLAQNLSALEFEKHYPDLALNAPENLRDSSVRLVVVKKNRMVLRKLLNDLHATRTPLDEIPALIVDIDTDVHQPGSIVPAITTRLLQALPRAQYVSYVSSPLFVDDQKYDFLVSSPRPSGYLGARELFDISGERAHVRRVDAGDIGLCEAVDMFVLTAALKVYRDPDSLRRHTMVVATGPRIEEQRTMRERLDALWRIGGFEGDAGRERLRMLLDNDVRPVSGLPLPDSFDELRPCLSEALKRIGGYPVATDTAAGEDRMWQIAVQSRATQEFTGDGLTVLYLDASVFTASMPRLLELWFGHRTGYEDLVRLYIPSRLGSRDAYEVLSEFWRSDDELRTELPSLIEIEPEPD